MSEHATENEKDETTEAPAGKLVRLCTAGEIAARQQAARDARVDRAGQDGDALLEAKLRAGGDPTKLEIVNAIQACRRRILGTIQDVGAGAERSRQTFERHGHFIDRALTLIVAASDYLVRFEAWRSRPWWRRRKSDRPAVPAALIEAIEWGKRVEAEAEARQEETENGGGA